MSERIRYSVSTVLNMKFYRLPQFMFAIEEYRKASDTARVLYSLLSDRLALSIKNKWINEQGDVYIVYPVSKLCSFMNRSNKTIIKAKKELIDLGLLEEEQTGRANKMYLLQPNLSEKDIYDIESLENDLDFGKEILVKGADGKTRSVDDTLQESSTRNVESSLQENSRNVDTTLQVEEALNQQNDLKCTNYISSENQKCTIYTSEVENVHSSNTNYNQTEEDNNKYKLKDDSQKIQNSAPRDESTQFTNQDSLTDEQQAITDTLNNTRLFTQQEVSELVDELTEAHATLEDVTEQLDNMRSIRQLFDPKRYFLNGVKKIIRLREFKAQSERADHKLSMKIIMHDWLNA